MRLYDFIFRIFISTTDYVEMTFHTLLRFYVSSRSGALRFYENEDLVTAPYVRHFYPQPSTLRKKNVAYEPSKPFLK